MKCPRCQQDNPPRAKFCLDCGASFKGSREGVRHEVSNADLQRALREALEQQAATSEILRVISESPTDAQPIFDAIVRNASRLCGGEYAIVTRYDGELLHLAAQHNPRPGTADETATLFPQLPRRDSNTLSGRALFEAELVHFPDIETEELEPSVREAYRRIGLRAAVAVPMVHEGRPVGVVSVSRGTPGPFSNRQIALLQTFADQAVIAIENVRLFKELEARNAALSESLEQQTATSDILRVISSSPTDVQPVFEAIAQRAMTLCGAQQGAVLKFDGELIHIVAVAHMLPGWAEFVHRAFPQRPGPGSASARAILTRTVVHIPDVLSEQEYELREGAVRVGIRAVLSVPMVRDDQVVGTITLDRTEPVPFSAIQIALLQTFADQAVIAIENVRLFKELQTKNRELTTALDQQTATAEILRAISSSLTDVQPVFNTIVESGLRLLGGYSATMMLLRDDDRLDLVAYTSTSDEADSSLVDAFPMPLRRLPPGERAIHERRAHAVGDVESAHDATDVMRETGRARGWRSNLFVPMIRDDVALGLISITRREPGPFAVDQIALLEIFAAQAVIAIENVRLFKELQARNRDLTATAQILQVISRSPTDVQPVFEAIADSAFHLFEAHGVAVVRYDGELISMAAARGGAPGSADAATERFREPHRPMVGFPPEQTVLTKTVHHVTDVDTDSSCSDEFRRHARERGFRSVVSIPMLRAGDPVGVIVISRVQPGAFQTAEIELLKTFADQAVIAIENVRLFKELQSRNRALTEALEQQTATSEILRVISQSQTDVRPVFDTIIRSAVRLLGGFSGVVTQIVDDQLHLAALTSTNPSGDAAQRALWPRLVKEDFSVHGQVISARAPRFVTDLESDPSVSPTEVAVARARGYQSIVGVPLLRDGRVVGSLTVTRRAPGPFSDSQIALLQTFADQAVIAIENLRLFTELEERNRALTTAHAQVSEALDQQTATSEILRVISQWQTDAQPVFDAIADNVMRLFRSWGTGVYRFDGEVVHIVAVRGGSPGSEQYLREQGPYPVSRDTPIRQCFLDRSIVHIPDVDTVADMSSANREMARVRGWRALLAVPMLRDVRPIGVIAVTRAEAVAFSPAEIDLLQTFADQAVIAIENVRLFTELQARTQELTRSVGQLTALGEVGRAVSSTLDLETVLSTIVSRAIQLSGTDGGSVYEYDEATEEFSLRASRGLPEAYVEQVRDTRPRKGEGAVGRVAQTREPVQIADISDAATYESRVRNMLLQIGLRALLAVPLIAEDQLVGALIVMRKRTGTFAAEEVTLLQTFATQSALAIQNARLFLEVEEKSRQLQVASQHKSEFLANMSHELRTPLNAIIGFSEVLSDRMFGELNDKQEEYLKDIHASGQHLLSLINDILDLSKVEAGRMELELTDFNLPATLDNALTLVRERAGRRGIALGLTVDERLEQIRADERKLRQVVLNLLSNAIKFTPEGGRIEVRALPVDRVVEISVGDTGVGIAPEDQEAIFEEFRQVGTAAKKVEGTGLGLALSRKFVELHGGRIWVESEVGAGSTFTFTIPTRT